MKWENKLSHSTYSASRLVYMVPGLISPGYSPFAPLALRKTSSNSLYSNRAGKSIRETISKRPYLRAIRVSRGGSREWR